MKKARSTEGREPQEESHVTKGRYPYSIKPEWMTADFNINIDMNVNFASPESIRGIQPELAG